LKRQKKDGSTTGKRKKKRVLDAKKRGLDDGVTTTFREIEVDKLDEAVEDLRFYRSSEFEDVLLDDLRREGALIPVIVRPKPNSDRFEIVDGVTRVRNERLLGKRNVLCQIIECDNATAIILGLKANIYRRRQDPVGLAKAFKTLHDQYKIKYRDIAKRFGYTRSWVSKLVALNSLSREYQEAVSRGDITIEDSYAIVSGERHVLEHIDERRQVHCEVCGRPFDALEVHSKRICFECERGYRGYRVQVEKRYEEDMKRAEERLRKKQKELIE
jgi:ParB/RepB/Spo0J family partition protein